MSFAQSVLERITTPAYVFDEGTIRKSLDTLTMLAGRAGLSSLYSLKAASHCRLLESIAPAVVGFSASSLFEVQLCKMVARRDQTVHLTSPLIARTAIDELATLCGAVSFNSLEQARRLLPYSLGRASCGLRLNPGLSLVKDRRYDPSGKHSKLGVPLGQIREALANGDSILSEIEGIHFHTNCEARSFAGVLQTVRRLLERIPQLLARVRWANIGGGYLFAEASDVEDLILAVDLLRNRGRCEVFFEPGAGVVQEAGVLVAEVVDRFRRDGVEIAVLDTSVNHWPEVFEYQFQPDLLGESDGEGFEYLLAGCTCLAGDVFGTYSFSEPLRVGSRLAFTGAGAYSLVKASYFNGVNLPHIYWVSQGGVMTQLKSFSFDDYTARNGAQHVLV